MAVTEKTSMGKLIFINEINSGDDRNLLNCWNFRQDQLVGRGGESRASSAGDICSVAKFDSKFFTRKSECSESSMSASDATL